jgi:VanZ family protein
VTAIRFQRNVEHRNFISGPGLYASEQLDIALDSSDEFRVARLGKPQLMQGADAVGVTVEDVIESQSEVPMAAVSFDCDRRTPHKNMSGPFFSPTTRYSRRSGLVRYLTAAYPLLVAYASLFPFSGWRSPVDDATAFVLADWPFYVTVSDITLNVLAYLPLGLLLTLTFMGRTPRWAAAMLGVLAGTLFSLLIELAQGYLPTRIASNVDLLTNAGGTVLGAAAAYVFGERWLLSGELFRLRGRYFLPGAATDYGFVLLALWLFTQFNAEIWLFGNGDLRHLVPGEVSVSYSAESYRYLEAAVAALNFAGVAFLLAALARSFLGCAVALIALTAAALALKTIASLALFIPGNPSLWLTPGSLLGLAIGVAAWLLLARAPRSVLIRAALVCLVLGLVVVNLAPENPYLVAALKVWRHGHYVSFNGMTRLLSALWPFLTLGYLILLARQTGGAPSARVK